MKSFLCFLALAFLTSCNVYNYGVDKDKTPLKYRTYYYSDKDKKTDFHTVLYSLMKPSGMETVFNYSKFTISIDHMQAPTGTQKYYTSKINFGGDLDGHDVKVLKNSIKLVHKTDSHQIIIPTKIVNDGNQYLQIYEHANMPSDMHEYIHINILVDGKSVVIEEKFYIELKPEYSFWDVLMGI